MRVKPEDFYSETPPPRIIGLECEYNLQTSPGSNFDVGHCLHSASMRARGINKHGTYLGSKFGSGRIYCDAGHLEFATAECLGPASAALEDQKGVGYISDIVSRYSNEHDGLYRLAGTYIENNEVKDAGAGTKRGESSGYHENYMIPREIIIDKQLFDPVLSSMIATRVWTMSGTLRSAGFVLSQKVWGMGGEPVERLLIRRTNHGHKPFILVPPVERDQDVLAATHKWARAEIRNADPGHSLVSRFLGTAAVSLTLRLLEQQHLFGGNCLRDISLVDPVENAKMFAADLSATKTVKNRAGKRVTALDVQEQFVEEFHYLNDRVQLPQDEQQAITSIGGLIDALRKSDYRKLAYDSTALIRAEFPARHKFIAKGFKHNDRAEISAHSATAMQRNLLWDRVLPQGYGRAYWDKISHLDPMVDQVAELATAAGLAPRAMRRASIIDEQNDDYVINWAEWQPSSGWRKHFGSPYGE